MASPLRELLAFFDISVNSEELEEASKKVEGFTGKLKLAGETLVEALAVREVKEFFTEQVENAAHMQDLSERLGVAATTIGRFGFAAKAAGVDVDTAAHTLGILERNMGLAMHGGKEQAEAFARLGVHLKDAAGHARPLDEVLGDLADGFAKLPDQQTRAAVGMHVLGRESLQLMPIFAKGREAMRATMEEAKELGSGLGDDFYEDAKRAREEAEHFTCAVDALKKRALAAALPTITRFLSQLKHWAKAVIDVTKRTNILQTLMLAIAAVAGMKLLSTVRALAVTFKILQPTITGTVSALMRFAAPLLIAAGLYLIFDELYTLMTGGKTIIGDTVDELMGVGSAAELGLELNAILKDTWTIVKALGAAFGDTLLGAVDTALAAVKQLGVALTDIMHGDFSNIGKDIVEAGKTDWDAAKRRFGGVAQAGEDIGATIAGGKVNQLNTLIRAGVDPRMLQAGAMGQATYGAGMATREGIVAQNTNNPLAHGWRVALPPGKGGRAGTKVDLKVVNHIHTAQDNHKAIGEAAGMGTASAAEKAMNAAHASTVAP